MFQECAPGSLFSNLDCILEGWEKLLSLEELLEMEIGKKKKLKQTPLLTGTFQE